MRAPSSLKASPLHAETESRMHAFRSNGRPGVQFWGVAARGVSTQPALCKYSCLQASGNGLTDVENYFNFCTSHTWDYNYNNGSPQEYKQTDTLDGSTFEPLTATIDIDTAGLFPPPAFWNNLFGYNVDPGIIGSAVDWDKTSTRSGITTALNGVDWTTLWSGGVTDSDFRYDRWQISFNAQGTLPANGAQPNAITGTYPLNGDGSLLSSFGAFGPNLLLSGRSGLLNPLSAGSQSSSDGLGVDLVRAQVQVRNFSGSPISYFIYEQATGWDAVTVLGSPGNTQRVNSSLSLANEVTVYRKLSEGFWTTNNQIIQLPDAAMDGPQTIVTSFGSKVRNGTIVSMVIGMTFDDWMFSMFGASWPNYVF